MRNLIVDPEFRDKIPPLSEDEFLKLEENIVSDREVREPLVVWNNIIVDGHHRWKIIQKHPEIPYRIKDIDFADKWAAIVWMCRNQLGRRNVTDEQKTVLIGEAYKAQKMTAGGDRKSESFSKDHNGLLKTEEEKTALLGAAYKALKGTRNGPNEFQNTAQKIAADFKVGEQTVKRAEHFLDGLNEAEKVSPGIKESILAGEVKAPKKVIADIRKMPEEKKVEVVEAIKRGDTVYPEYIPMKNATPVEERPAYNTKDFENELAAVVSSLDKSLKTTLVLVHREMLNEKAGIEAAKKVLASAHEAIAKYENMVKEIEHAESI